MCWLRLSTGCRGSGPWGRQVDIKPRHLPRGRPGCITHEELGQIGWKEAAPGSCVGSRLFRVQSMSQSHQTGLSSSEFRTSCGTGRGSEGGQGKRWPWEPWVGGCGLQVGHAVLASRIRHTHPPAGGELPPARRPQASPAAAGTRRGAGPLFPVGKPDPEGGSREGLNPAHPVPCVKLSRWEQGRAVVLPPEPTEPSSCFPRSYVWCFHSSVRCARLFHSRGN